MKWYQAFAALLCSLTLLACESEKDPALEPEDVALEFFSAIYVDEDLQRAQNVSGTELKELLGHYRNMHAIKRHIIGMEIVRPEIQVKDSSADFFRRLADDVKVELHFTSKVDGRVYKDIRIVLVSKGSDGRWQVQKVLADPFATNG